MHIQLIALNVDTRFTNHPNKYCAAHSALRTTQAGSREAPLALLDETLRNTSAQKQV